MCFDVSAGNRSTEKTATSYTFNKKHFLVSVAVSVAVLADAMVLFHKNSETFTKQSKTSCQKSPPVERQVTAIDAVCSMPRYVETARVNVRSVGPVYQTSLGVLFGMHAPLPLDRGLKRTGRSSDGIVGCLFGSFDATAVVFIFITYYWYANGWVMVHFTIL